MLARLAAAAALAIAATVAHAQGGAIAARKDAMNAQGDATKEPGAMMKGQAPFDLAKVQEALRVFQEQSTKLKDLWPEDSRTGDTRAQPAVWDRKADFLAKFDKLAADAKAAEASIKDEATFKQQWGRLIFSNCVACHKDYQKAGE